MQLLELLYTVSCDNMIIEMDIVTLCQWAQALAMVCVR